MEMEKIINVCKKHDCVDCPFYDVSEIICPEGPVNTSECIFDCIPQSWDKYEIERRYNKYGKKEN